MNEPCKLYCVADTSNYVFTIKHTATDGMKCGADDNNICVQGECQAVGCDWIVGSNLQNDICGMCNGDNSTCRVIQGEYLEQPKLNSKFYVGVLRLLLKSDKITRKNSKRTWIISKMTWIISKITWKISKRTWIISKITWIISKITWIISKRTWIISKITWIISKRTWIISKRTWIISCMYWMFSSIFARLVLIFPTA